MKMITATLPFLSKGNLIKGRPCILNRITVAGTLAAALLLSASNAFAGNGHMLHGFGPVNSSMGGAGAGLFTEPVGALMFNPALVVGGEGHQITFASEFFEDGVRIDTTLNDGTTGRMSPSNQIGVLPSFGWMMHEAESKWGVGFGLVAMAGFRTDYHEDPSSILFDTPPDGFGRIYTDYRVIKIPFALAYQVTEDLALGVSLNGYVSELAIAPLPHKDFDENGAGRFYPQGGNLDSGVSVSAQFGFLYKATPKVNIGGSVTTPQNYKDYAWNSTISNPTDPNFGAHRRLKFDLDGPLMATLGTGITLNKKTSVAIDGMFVKYTGVSGFGSPGGIIDRVIYPFGWRNIWVFKAGVQHKLNDKFTVRAGFNWGQTPLKSEKILTATGAPSTFQKHFSGGFQYRITESLAMETSFYIVPRESITGPHLDIDNNVLGTIETSNKLTSLLVGLNWKF